MTKKCSKHPNVNAYDHCESCGEHFCQDCLSTGRRYGHCYKAECQKMLEKEYEKINSLIDKICFIDEYVEARKKLKDGTYEAIIIDKILADYEAQKAGKPDLYSVNQVEKWEKHLFKKRIIKDPYEQTEEEKKVVSLEDLKILKKSRNLKKKIYKFLFNTNE